MNAPLTLPRHKLTIEDYHRMGRAGILTDATRVELLEGELIDMAPIGSQHVSLVARLDRFFQRQVGDSAIVFSQSPVSLPPDNEPQPDVVLLKPRTDWYEQGLPTAQDVLLVIEVADTTVERDREFKCPLYARYGIPEFWLFHVQAKVLEVYQEPADRGYGKLVRFERDEIVSPLLLAGIRLSLIEIWPAQV